MHKPFRPTAALAAAALLLGGCASFSSDGGFGRVGELTRERTGQTAVWQRSASDTAAAEARIGELLREPLDADRAVEVALLNNRGLQADFFELGIAEAELVQAGRLANPAFGFGHLQGGGVTEIDRSIVFNVLSLITMPAARQVQQRRFEEAQFRAAFAAVGVASETRRAFYEAVAAQDLERYHEQVKEAADVSGELARRMLQAGNFNKLAQMRQQSFQADATARLARASHRALAERERLARLLGASGAQLEFKLQERLPDLPGKLDEIGTAEQTAMDRRLDILAARRSVDATARQLGLTRATGFVNALELGYANKSQSGEPRRNGYEVSLELPIFDFGSTRAASAEATYMRSVNQAAAAGVNARSQVREAHSAYRAAYEVAKQYRDDIVPLKKRISEENVLRYNGMLIDVFELLSDAREQVAGVTGYVEALRDFWIARTDLQTAMTSRSPSSAGARASDAAGN